MLDLQIIPTAPALHNGRKPAMQTREIMLVNRNATASAMESAYTRFSTTVDVWWEDRIPLRMQRGLASITSRRIIFYKVFFWVHNFIFVCPMPDNKFKCI